MQVIISNLLDIEAYIKAIATPTPRVAGLTDYCYVGAGEEFNNAIEAYFGKKYKAGLTLFFGIFDTIDKIIQQGDSQSVINTQVLIMTKANPKIPYSVLEASNATWLAMTKLIGTIETDMECSVRTLQGKKLRIDVVDRKLHPLEGIANVNAYGFAIELSFTIPSNTFKYSA